MTPVFVAFQPFIPRFALSCPLRFPRMQGHLVNLLFFLKASSLTYTASSCLAVAANQVAWHRPSPGGFAVALGDWASGVSALGLAVALALALPELPAAAAACLFLVLAPFLRNAISAQLAVVGFLVLCSKAQVANVKKCLGAAEPQAGAAWDGPWGRGRAPDRAWDVLLPAFCHLLPSFVCRCV
eukprot:s10533_g1.t1